MTAMALDVAFCYRARPACCAATVSYGEEASQSGAAGRADRIVCRRRGEAAAFLTGPAELHEMLMILVLLLATLLLFMSGRIVAAAAGQFYRQGRSRACAAPHRELAHDRDDGRRGQGGGSAARPRDARCVRRRRRAGAGPAVAVAIVGMHGTW
jgi:hypothetical protein